MGVIALVGDFGLSEIKDEAIQAKQQAQEILDSITNLENIGYYNANTNIATTTSGNITLTATPPPSWKNGQYLEVTVAGNVGFGGSNFANGQLLSVGDSLRKMGGVWYLTMSNSRFTRDFIKNLSPVFSATEENVLKAIKVLDLTVPTAQKNNDWRITFASTVPKTVSLQANFKYRLQIRNLDTGTNFALVNENATFDANLLNGDKFYNGNVTLGSDTISYNISIDWNFLLSLGANFEFFDDTTSNLRLKTGVFTQKEELVKLINAGDIVLKNTIDNLRYDFLADKTKSFTTNENHILRAIKVIDITVPSLEKTDDWRITFVSTVPVNSALIANFKYRLQIRNLTKAKDYALVNENVTFDANSLNGYKSYSGTATNGTTSVEFNVQIDWQYLLGLGSNFEFFDNINSNLLLRKGVFTQSSENVKKITDLETSNTTITGTKIPAIENILSDFYPTRLYTINDGFYVANTTVGLVPPIVPNGTRRYVKLSVKTGDSFYVTSTVNGSALALATFVDVNNVVLSVVEPGVDNTDHVHVNYALTPPANAVFCYIDGSTAVDIVIDRMRPNFWFGIDGSINPSSSRRYAKYPISPTTDRLKVTTIVNGGGVYAVVYLNASGTVINGASQGQGINGNDKTYTELLLVPPSTATHFILNSNLTTSYYIYTPFLIQQAASKVDIKTINDKFLPLSGKNIVTWGTSLVETSTWPVDAPAILGGTGINKGVGSSVARISKADGTIDGLAWENVTRSLMQTLAEKEDLIANWATKRLLLSNNPPATLDSISAEYIRNCSFERRVLPFLNGTLPMPDIFLLEHARNDNYASDTDAQYTTIPADRTDRRFYLGAMNYLIDLIYKYNPYARIALIGYYEKDLPTRIRVTDAQMVLARYWNIPILKTWEQSGFSQQLVLGSHVLWSQAPWSLYIPAGQNTSLDMSVQRVQIPDGIHFNSDTTGKAQAKMTKIVTNFLRDL